MKKDLKVTYLDSDNIVRFGFDSPPSIMPIRGFSNLIQKIIIYLLTEIGSNYFSPTIGSNFSTSNRINWSRDNDGVIKAMMSSAVLQVENKIKQQQALESDLIPSEILKSLEIDTIDYDQINYIWYLTIMVNNLAGQSFTVNI